MTSSCSRPQPILLVHYFVIPFIIRFFQKLVKYSKDQLTISFPSTNQEFVLGSSPKNVSNDVLKVRLFIKHPVSLLYRLLIDRKIGIGEAYMAGDWYAEPSPRDLLRLLIRARRSSPKNGFHKEEPTFITSLIGQFFAFVGRLVQGIVRFIGYLEHQRRKNTLTGSRSNIRKHYDLGNDLFSLFLDETMTYSCALFEVIPKDSLELADKDIYDAQIRKYDAMLDMLELKPTDHVLEVGCGWGYAGIHAVRKYGCKWTGMTISQQQYDWAIKKVQEAGLEDKIEIKFLDYRLETGVYDKILSIEMIEAVGHEFLPSYFKILRDRLKPGGIASIQAILCPDEQYERYRKSTDFIKKHIFPGGHLPSLKAIDDALPEELKHTTTSHVGRHYAVTLDIWCRAWLQKRSKILEMGYSEEFFRKWEFYFAMCSALFEFENIKTAQMSFVRN